MERIITSLGKVNVAKMKNAFGFRNINQVVENYALVPKAKKYTDAVKQEALEFLRDDYNDAVKELNKQEKTRRHAVRLTQKAENEVKTFTIDIRVQIIYHKYPDKIFYKDIVTDPFTRPVKDILGIINKFNDDEGYKSVKVISSKVNYLNTEKLKKERKPKIKMMMKRSFVLKNDWLHYAKHIAKYAFDETDDMCVYHQLTNYLLNPPTGRPTKFIDGERTSIDAIYNFLNAHVKEDCLEEDYPDFKKNSGVSTELISILCKNIKRSLYAYDEDDKCFYSVLAANENYNYCPIVYYKLHGHMYLLNNPDAIRSVAEANKPTAKKMITSSVEELKDEKEFNKPIYHIDEFDIDNAMNLSEGIYLLQKSNITEETLQFISLYNSVPKTKNRDNVIVQISYKNRNDEIVYVACDANYGQNIDYDQLKQVATDNKIKYINEGIGSVILDVIEKSKIQERKTLTEKEKASLLKDYKNRCAICNVKAKDYEIDHIVPLSAGGSNDIENLQPLCKDCHKQKTKEEKELGMYKVTDESASYFNKKVNDEVCDTIGFKVWQFVEKVNDSPKIVSVQQSFIYVDGFDLWKNPIIISQPIFTNIETELPSFKIDMRKCRRNLAYFCKYEFPVYSVMDSPTIFSGEIKCGIYYIVTTNTYPFRGSGWYYEPLVIYGLDQELININEIKLEFIPSRTLPNNYFQNNINTLLKAFDNSLQKVCVNAYIGLMGRTKRTESKSKFTLCHTEAAEWWGSNNDNEEIDKSIFIRNHKLENNEMLYEGIESKNIISESSTYPIYAMILQMEAMELHKLESIIKSKGGFILDRNTDAIRYAAKKELDISNYFWDDENKVPKYQTEISKPLEVERMAKFCRNPMMDIEKFILNWNIIYDYDTTADEKAKEIVDSNTSYHIDGRAGTGKSFLTNKVIEELKMQNK